MRSKSTLQTEKKIRWQENLLFFRRWLKHPLQMGTLAPITPRLAHLAASFLPNSHEKLVVEIGAGTGRLTRVLLGQGVKPENLAVVELDPFCCAFLQKTLPTILKHGQPLPTIIEGDATKLVDLLPHQFVGQVDTVFSVIPLMYLSPLARQNLMNAAFQVLKPGGSIIHITYSLQSPLRFMTHIKQHRQGQLWLNMPPGFIWHYQQG